MTTPLSFHLDHTPISPERDDVGALEARFANFFGGAAQTMRLISCSRRLSFAPVRQSLRQLQRPLDDLRPLIAALEAAAVGTDGASVPHLVAERRDTLARLAPAAASLWPQLERGEADPATIRAAIQALAGCFWRARWLANYRAMYDTLEREEPMLTLDHYALVWPEGRVNPAALAATLQSSFLLPRVQLAPLPRLIPGVYHEAATHLIPLEEGLPLLRVLTAYDIRDWWDFWSWHELLFGSQEVALALDIRTMPRGKAQTALTNVYKTLEVAVHGRYAEKDMRSEGALHDVQLAMQHLTTHNLHELGMAILIQAPTLSALDDQTQQLTDSFGARLKLDVMHGGQAELAKLFTPTHAKAIGAPLARRNAMSIHLAATLPWALGKSTSQRGICWGFDPFQQIMVLHDLFGITGTDNPHGLVLGKAGSGKTVLFNLIGLRHAVLGHQVVFFDPVGKCRQLAEAAGYGGVVYDVATTMSLNILDPLETAIARQLSQVLTKLSLVLGRATRAGSGVRYAPRILTNAELTVLDAALQSERIYGRDGAHLPQLDDTTAPLLGDLVGALRELGTATADSLADEIAGVALQSRAATFGQRTSLRWDFSADVCCYNLQRADPMLLPLLLDHGLASLDSYVRTPARLATGRGLLCLFDEYGVLSQIDTLRDNVAYRTKEYRNYKAGMFTGDQNTTTYMGGSGDAALLQAYTANNTAIKLIGRQEGTDVALLAEAYSAWLGPREIQAIRTAGPGEFVGIFGNEVHHLRVQPTNEEWPFFIRSA